MFKQRLLIAFLLSVGLIGVFSYLGSTTIRNRHQNKMLDNNGSGFAVVELFTSEGCSSCPPADEAVAQLLKSGQKNVYVLGFHVDYWNSLGWKDIFSNADYSTRQQEYGKVFRLNSVYTPQAVVNGKTEFTGSDTKRLHDAVEEGLTRGAGNTIELSAKVAADNNVVVAFKLQSPINNGTVNIALVQLHAQSNVQRGENSGRVLNHVNVVRCLKTIRAGQIPTHITLAMPIGVAAENCKIIAFTQDEHLQITSATETTLH